MRYFVDFFLIFIFGIFSLVMLPLVWAVIAVGMWYCDEDLKGYRDGTPRV
jgi:hypothetical protein